MKSTHTLRRPPEQTPGFYVQDELEDNGIVYAHYSIPGLCANWYVIEYDPDRDIAYGWTEVHEGSGELGFTSMRQLEAISMRVRHISATGEEVSNTPYRVEFDTNWSPCTLHDLHMRQAHRT